MASATTRSGPWAAGPLACADIANAGKNQRQSHSGSPSMNQGSHMANFPPRDNEALCPVVSRKGRSAMGVPLVGVLPGHRETAAKAANVVDFELA